MPHTAYIVDCVRVASGRKNGALAKWHPADLGAVVVDELVTRAKVPPAAVDDVIFGCVSQVGAQAGNIGRMVVLSSKVLPETVPGTVVDRQCGSSLQAIHFAAQAVMSGTQDVVIAGGVEVMSLVPIGASLFDGANAGHGAPNSAGIKAKYPANDGLFSQFEGAEIVANDFSLSRADLEALAVRSHKLAAQAQAEKRFDREIVAVAGVDKAGREIVHRVDEGVRPTTTLEALAKLPTLKAGGKITPGTSSPITDGAAAVLICNERALRKYNLRPRAKIIGLGLSGTDPVSMLKGPIPATSNALKAAGLSMSDIDLFEVNEAFASVPLAWAKALKADINKLNVNGGAMALGHPLGATGAKLTTTLVNELERSKKRYGLIAICEGGGTANATVFERVDASAASKL